MTRLLIVIVICIIGFMVLKLLFKITSFIIKTIIWLTIVVVGIYVINYFVLPKFSKKPYDIEKKFVEPIKKSGEKVVLDIEKKSCARNKKSKRFSCRKI